MLNLLKKYKNTFKKPDCSNFEVHPLSTSFKFKFQLTPILLLIYFNFVVLDLYARFHDNNKQRRVCGKTNLRIYGVVCEEQRRRKWRCQLVNRCPSVRRPSAQCHGVIERCGELKTTIKWSAEVMRLSSSVASSIHCHMSGLQLLPQLEPPPGISCVDRERGV